MTHRGVSHPSLDNPRNKRSSRDDPDTNPLHRSTPPSGPSDFRDGKSIIVILTTGGTIDGLDYTEPSDEPEQPSTRVAEALSHLRLAFPIEVTPVFSKDSQLITDDDLLTLLNAVTGSMADRLVVTHGTETLARTAKFLGVSNVHKTVVIVGAMSPLFEGPGDAQFNLGVAIMAVQLLAPGVYVAMNGRVLTWNNVAKDRTAGRFISLQEA